jgi:xanthine/CO dehydrogenase XdhC/CoxF family maturation factor
MHEPLHIARCLQQLSQLGEPAVLATVVGVSGSAYRREGARMLITPSGARVGCVSGGCLERDVRSRGQRLAVAEAALVTYDSTADADTQWSLSLGCNGRVEILIEKLSPAKSALLANHLLHHLTTDRPALLATLKTHAHHLDHALHLGATYVPSSSDETSQRLAKAFPQLPQLLADTGGPARIGPAEFLLEHVQPPQRLVIFGAGWDAVPLATAAKAIGWHVTVVDARDRYLTPDHFPNADRLLTHIAAADLPSRAAAVVMTHDVDSDLSALHQLFNSDAGYIGLLGSRGRSARLLADLTGRIPPHRLEALHAPVGLNLGAQTPAEIAASIVSEVLAWRNDRTANPLRDSSPAAAVPT